ncbi:MAG: undecaprenyldiphospho-muramoylpentapeptide beta-N-acetylglucosaminyltransferase [Ardenticatenaceae bacterium]|nr:undecaprenyldiphospho-muramoylpentapeptide beta-N-acetylglucosaminyltransferase [Ardenticatenaceae bacterium]
MRLVIAGGGTGGHVYPALSVLQSRTQRPTLLWIGTGGGLEQPLVERAGIPFVGISAGGLRGLGPGTVARNSLRLARGFVQAWRWLRTFQADVVFATGGYVTVPVGLAAWLQRRPLLIELPDLEPGLAIKALAPLANAVVVSAEPTAAHFAAGKAIVTGYPVRLELAHPKPKAVARTTFDIGRDERLLLVTGGSQGAHSLNRAVAASVAALTEIGHVIHVHGRSDGQWLQAQRAALPTEQQGRYHLFDYLHAEMVDALVAADLVVARAGASALGEFPAAHLPAILVPYPYSGAHQWANATFLAERGAAVTVADDRLATELVPLVQSLLGDEQRLDAMRRTMAGLARPDAAERIFELLQGLATSVTASQQAHS